MHGNTSATRTVSKNIFNVWTEGNMTQNKQLISGSLLSISAGKYTGRQNININPAVEELAKTFLMFEVKQYDSEQAINKWLIKY